MSLIDGIGNEVLQFFIVLVCGIVGLLAWWSTGQRQRRTAIFMERNIRNIYRVGANSQNGQQPRAVVIVGPQIRRSQDNNRTPIPEPSNEEVPVQNDTIIADSDNANVNQTDANVTESLSQNETIQDREMNIILDTMDSETSILRNRRIAFFNPLSTSEPAENADNTNVSNVNPSNNENPVSEPTESQNEDPVQDDTNTVNIIKIRLKFLDDELRLVEASSQETLEDFKMKHFKDEINANKFVRLIFKGKVLQREAATLEACGLFDDCVVHCLIHQIRPPRQTGENPQQPNINRTTNNLNTENQNTSRTPPERRNQEERDWDLSHVLFTMLASLLSIAWYIHIRFSTLFGVAASLAMLGLTAIYIIAVMCVYFPEAHPLRGNPAPPSPTRAREVD